MGSKYTAFTLAIYALLLISLFNIQTVAQVNVTMRLNTSTCLDTLRPTDIVQIRGDGTAALTWDAKSTAIATNIGGDYWEVTFKAFPGNLIRYKIWTGYSLSPEVGTFHWSGWEGPINAGAPSDNNRLLQITGKDTVLNLQYYNGWENTVPQYWRPFQSKQDSVAVYFRVNMGGVAFDPATQLVDVRGGLPMGGATSWTTIKTLSRESNSVNSGSFQSGVAYIPKDSIVAGVTQQQFKFVIQPDNWESSSNRSFVFSGTNDTTIHWYYFNNRPPSGPAVTADVLFRLKLDALEKAGLFDESLGDRVAVTGAKGWPPSGFDFDTEPTMLKMTYNTTLEEWNLVENFTKFPGEVIPYKYYIRWDTSRVDTASVNYIPGLDLQNGWEEPGFTGGADRNYTYTSDAQQFIAGDFGEEQQFFNSIDSRGVITTPIDVAFKINMTPATDVNENPTNPLFRPGIDTVYVQFDGCMTPITQGLTMYGTDNRLLLTDLDGDLVYTGTWSLNPPTFYQFCYRIVYTSPSGEIWNGSGSAIRGRRYYQYVHPASVNGQTVIWPVSYQLAELPWMLDSLTIEDPPSFLTDNNDIALLPNQYSVSQNYPNPFNPVTRIQYNLPQRTKVKMEIYDITGRLVHFLSDAEQDAGVHIADWNGNDSYGNSVASGIYFLKFNAGGYSKTLKMMLMK
ncbi:MAG: T9SS type A sorting domain-containing protein [Ignavibacteriaceae bacterium]|nr:T9SS type A sorting domain-containing protein [Ignavibacteriaceae bacterium]